MFGGRHPSIRESKPQDNRKPLLLLRDTKGFSTSQVWGGDQNQSTGHLDTARKTIPTTTQTPPPPHTPNNTPPTTTPPPPTTPPPATAPPTTSSPYQHPHHNPKHPHQSRARARARPLPQVVSRASDELVVLSGLSLLQVPQKVLPGAPGHLPKVLARRAGAGVLAREPRQGQRVLPLRALNLGRARNTHRRNKQNR